MTTERSTGPSGAAYRISRVLILFVYAFAIACTIVLATQFFLELFNASSSAPFVRWVARASARIMQPFRGIFPPLESEGGSVFDPAVLFAIFMYWLLAMGMHALVAWIDRKIAAQRAAQMWGARSAPAGPPGPPPPAPPLRIPDSQDAPPSAAGPGSTPMR